MDLQVTDLDLQVAVLDLQVADLDLQVADLDLQVADLDLQVADLDLQVTVLDLRVTVLDLQVADLDLRVADSDPRVISKTLLSRQPPGSGIYQNSVALSRRRPRGQQPQGVAFQLLGAVGGGVLAHDAGPRPLAEGAALGLRGLPQVL